eukprot:CAMPEP_0172663096 /NCGR_PEP_ID=MMETSP1074-20121228/5710_1 /TAXON_ID=2916 /ORGANISM="Ceratium fusus, Strain PA161109" /LENGTH=461 /DNA_ID=CAMNT_0013479043 /DNA_START=90 /DNA_END=1475 /DNA_ORIENTATION=+
MADWAVGGPYLIAYMVFSVVVFVMEFYLDVRQYRKNCTKEVPPELKYVGVECNKEEFLKTQDYQKDKRLFGFVKDPLGFAWAVFNLFYTGPALWHFSSSLFEKGDYFEYKCTLCWLFLQGWVDKPLSSAFSLYSSFVLEEKHGFNKMTLGLWISDLAKSELLSYFFGGLLIPLLIWVVNSTGERFYLYAWGTCQTLIFAFMWIYPNVIQPMFNKFEELKDEELRKKICNLAAEHNFPLTKLFQVDGSKRSSHSNAYFFGFWKFKRIVLFDTLLKDKDDEDTKKGTDEDKKEEDKKESTTPKEKLYSHSEILAVLCHELGHWKFNHTTMMLVISSAHIFILFYLFGQVMYSGESSQAIVRQFGYAETKSVMVSLTIFMMMFEPTEKILQLLMTLLTRRNEFQADGFAVSCGRARPLVTGLKTLSKANKGDLNPDPWYSWYHHSHPPLVERLKPIMDAAKKEK